MLPQGFNLRHDRAVTFLRRVSAVALAAAAVSGVTGAQQAGGATPFVPALASPRGPYGVGTSVFVFTDSTRPEPTTAEEADRRTLVVQLWYPVSPGTAGSPAPYMPELDTLGSAFKSGVDALRRIDTHAVLDAPAARTATFDFTIVFSHGMGNPRSFYTTLVSDWASHGFLVASIDHPGMGFVALPGGQLVRPYDPWTKAPPGLRDRPEADRDAYWAPGRAVFSADQRFVAGELERLNRTDQKLGLRGRIPERLIHVGHSDGFLSQTCATDSRFVGCVNLDGVPALAERQSGLRVPYLAIRDGNDAPVVNDIYKTTKAPAFDVVLKGASHNSSTDLGLFSAAGASAATGQLHVISDIVIAFARLALTPGGGGEFERRVAQMPGVELRAFGLPSATRSFSYAVQTH